jgi:hypothetical protein
MILVNLCFISSYAMGVSCMVLPAISLASVTTGVGIAYEVIQLATPTTGNYGILRNIFKGIVTFLDWLNNNKKQ